MAFELSYAGIPLCMDTAKVVRLDHKHSETSPPEQLEAPRKHQPMADLIDELDKLLPFMYLQDFQLPGDYPGRDLGALAYRAHIGPYPNPSVKIGDWYYPTTASRWSVFRGLATSTAVQAMLEATNFSASQGCIPAEFVMHCDPLIAQTMTRLPDQSVTNVFGPQLPATKYRLTSQMYMLPPRPLADHGTQFDGLYLITLVDERYYYQYSPVSLKVTNTSTWLSLITQCAAALNITIGFVDVPAVLGAPEPDSHLWSTMESAPVLLDAIAYNIGDVIVRQLDGSLKFLYANESQTIAKVNRGNARQVLRLAGGEIFSSGIGNLARNEVIPEAVNVTFPKYVVGNDPVPHFLNSRYQNPRPTSWFEESFGEDFTITVQTTSGNEVFAQNPFTRDLFPVSGLTGVRNHAHTIHTTAKALYSGEVHASLIPTISPPLNYSGMVRLSMELASQYFQYQTMEALDEVYPGTYAWIPEGYHDIIWTFSARAGRACTRILKTQWNQMVTERQIATVPPSGYLSVSFDQTPLEARPTGPYVPKGMGGPSVAQTIRDSEPDIGFPARVNTLLAAPLTIDGTTATFESVAYFPTQNRWRGRIDNEDILFDGTSGGNAFGTGTNIVTIAFRAIDGTLAAVHPTESIVNQIAPSVTYGVNLTTYEKMSYAYPSDWTSGGIMGVNIVPQTQSVVVLDDVGKLLNGIRHYSGVVSVYDTTLNVGFQWGAEELVWVVERNAGTVTENSRYNGQLVGYSPDGPVAPIYAVNETTDGGGVTTDDCRLQALDLYGNSSTTIVFSLSSCPLAISQINAALGGGYDTLRFDPCDFIVSTFGTGRCPGAFAATIKTRGLTQQVNVLDPDCNTVVLSFRDGLLQQVQTLV